jgi:hypothetical protein
MVSAADSPKSLIQFSRPEPLLFFQVVLFQTHCYAENLVVPGNKSGTSGFVARNSDC